MQANSEQFFLKQAVSEEIVILLVSELSGISFDSVEFEISGSIGAAQISTYPMGFLQGALFTWPASVQSKCEFSKIIGILAEKLGTSVLLESSPWLLASPDGSVAPTEVVDMEDGINIKLKVL